MFHMTCKCWRMSVLLCTVAVCLFSSEVRSDVCHEKKGNCIPPGHTCTGVSREYECRFAAWRCCYLPQRGKRKKREARQLSLLAGMSHDLSRDSSGP